MLAYINRKENKLSESNSMLEAARRIIKDRKDVMSLTAKTGTWSQKGSNSEPSTPEQVRKNNYELRISPSEMKMDLKHTKSLNTC